MYIQIKGSDAEKTDQDLIVDVNNDTVSWTIIMRSQNHDKTNLHYKDALEY